MLFIALLILAALLLPAPQAAGATVELAGPALARETAREKNTRLLRHTALAPLPIGDRVRLDGFDLGDERTVDLDLERFDVFTPDAVVIDATPLGEVQVPRPDVVLLRGHVVGDPTSRVFLGISSDGTHGYVRDGDTMQIVSSGLYGPQLGENFAVEVTNALDLANDADGPPTCGNGPDVEELYPLGVPNPPAGAPAGDNPPPCRSARMAIDSDWEFTNNLFGGNTTASRAYATTLVAAMSEIYLENFNTEFTMPYLRAWSHGGDPYTVTSGTLPALEQFRDHWRNTKSHVGRDLAHLLSAKSLGGGIAYINVVCNSQWGFGLSANLNGTFPYPLQNHHVQNWDINVISHEVGHNFGTGHTHEYNPTIDDCGNADCSASYGGTIMSYCHVCPGGMTNIVLEFHPTVITWVMTMLDAIPCDLSVSCPVTDPGMYVGASGGSWFVDSNWGGGVVPSGSTDVTIPTLVLVDSPGAVASTVTIADGGTLEMANGTATLAASQVTVESGGALTGVGTVTAPVDNSGTVAPGVSPTSIGTLVIASTFTQQAGGVLAIDIDGYTPGTQHDLLAVTTTATLGGSLVATVTGGFTPLLQSVDYLAAATVSGAFATTSLPADLPGAFSFIAGADATSAYLITVGAETCAVPTTSQWASYVIGFTSQYSHSTFSALQTLGAPNVFAYGNNSLTWAASSQDGTLEHLTLGFNSLVYATGVTVRETWGNGFVTRVDVVDIDDQLHTVWTGSDPSAPGAPADFLIQWTQTAYLVKGVRIYIDTDATAVWEEIDAVRIHGVPGPNNEWADSVIGFSSEWSPTVFSASQTLGAPDVTTYGNNSSAWAASSQDGTLEHVTVGFPTQVFATGVTVRETWGNGFVYAVDVVDTSDQLHPVWSGADPSSAGAPANFRINWSQTGYLVKGVRVHVDTDATADWEEIDAVQLHGVIGEFTDCNGNGVVDACDVLAGTSVDLNADGLPDECDFAPGIDSLGAAPDPLPAGQTLTLTANGVTDTNDDVAIVRFYRDLDDDGELDGSDTLLGSDSSATGGWTWAGATDGFPAGPMRFFAQAEDGAALTSTAVAAIVTVQIPLPPGLYTGAPGGSWFAGGNWGAGVVPGAGTAVVIDGSVALDGPGAQAASVTITDGGTLTFSSGGALTVSSGVTVESGGTLTGSGTITGDVVNGGEVAPGAPVGTLSITGAYTQQAAGTLDISVDGYTAGTEHDVLGVGGVATLAGTLDVTTLGSFTPTPASTVQFLTASSFAGAFGTANLPTLSGSNSFVRQQNATNETLVTVGVADCAMPEVLQWASSVIGFSSEWSTHWFGSVQMLGAPNVSVYGVNKYGWTASAQNGSVEHVTLGFATPVFASGVTIREHNGNGFVTQVDVVDMDDVLHTVWTGSDPSAQSAGIVNFLVEWAQTSYLVKGVRVYVDMDTTADWEQIDAVQLRGSQGPISQWADHVLGFSSHWSASSFSADQTLGAPDVPQYGNNASAWASSSQDGTLEQVTVGFATPVYATGVTVRETWGNGFVYRVEVVDMSDGLHTVWTGADPSSPGAIANFLVQWPQTTYLVKGVRVHVDTDATADWEEIDAIQLHGIDADIADCNGNGIIDTCDILGGASADLNADGIPDECVFAPGITSLAASPDPVAQGATVTLTASGVVDPNDDVAIVRFYHDADDDGALDGSDTLLGSDNDESGGWSWAGSTGAVPQGVRRFFARAEDGGGLLSSVVSVLATVSEAPDPGEWTGAPGGSWFGSSNWGGGSVPNAGTTVTIASSVVIDSAGALASSVTIQSGGTLTFASGGTLTAAGGVTIESGGTLTGVGTITGNVVNGGDVAPGSAVGTITVTGSYTQQASGRLLVEVDGYTPGSGHDVLSVGTSATFGGTVDVTTLGGFSPVDTSVVQFLTAASTSGVFGGASLPTLAGGFSFVLSEMATDARLTTVGVSHCDVASFRQWAGSVIGFSSQYSTSTFSAQQILGPPSVFTYGNDPTAWASSSENGTSEYVTLGFPVEVYATGVLVRETLGNGFVTQVDVVDTSDVLHTVWSGADPSVPGTPVDFVVSWSKTAYLVKGVRVYVDTDATAGWEEIDAIELHGSPGETEAWASSVIDFTSQWESHQFAAAETTGAPDVPTYSNHPRAWAASQANGTLEYLTVGFSTPMYATGVTVRETWGNGFVYQVDVLDTSDAYHTVWTGTDPSTPGSIAEYKVTWTQTSYPVKGVRVHIDTDATSHFEEVDAIKLHGVPAPEGSWATSVIGFSSEWSGGVFSAQQVVGAPNVLTYGNNGLAWASSSRDGTSETLTMGYHTPLYASAVTVRETWGNGFVTQIDLLDTDDAYHTVWSGTDTSTPGLPADFRVSFTETAYLAKGVRVHVDTDATAGWEEIDAVLLHGRTSVAGDCNGNGIADACDIAVGTSLDVNVNGIPDECEAGPAASVFAAPNGFGGLSGDLTGDLTGNPIDTLFDVLEGWGACRSIANCPGDLDGNGYVDADDLFAIWAGNGWGR